MTSALIAHTEVFMKKKSVIILFVMLTACRESGSASFIQGSLPGKINVVKKCSLPSEISFTDEKVKVIGIFTTWSSKSQIMMERFKKARSYYSSKKKPVSFNFVFIDTDSRVVDHWHAMYKPDFTVLYDKDFRFCGNRITNVPVTLILGRGNRVCYVINDIETTKLLSDQIEEALDNCK